MDKRRSLYVVRRPWSKQEGGSCGCNILLVIGTFISSMLQTFTSVLEYSMIIFCAVVAVWEISEVPGRLSRKQPEEAGLGANQVSPSLSLCFTDVFLTLNIRHAAMRPALYTAPLSRIIIPFRTSIKLSFLSCSVVAHCQEKAF